MSVYEILHVFAEGGAAGTSLGSEAGFLTFLVLTIDGTAQGTGFVALIVEVARLLVASIEIRHLVISIGELLNKHTIEIILVQVIVVVALTL